MRIFNVSIAIPFIVFTLCFRSVAVGQNVYEIYITSFSEGKELKNVQFTLLQNDQIVVEQPSKNGTFQFIIMENDGKYVLKASKEGFVSKIINFNSIEYPFSNEYEIQEIDVAFNTIGSTEDKIEVGELKWSNLAEIFNVVKVDSSMEIAKKNFANSEKKLGEIYSKSIENGDELMSLNEPKIAERNYEVALLAKPDDEYAKKKIVEIEIEQAEKNKDVKVFVSKEVIDQINKGDLAHIPTDQLDANTIYSVQLGAFSKKIDLSKFQNVPNFKTIQYEDYTRCFSGEFSDPNEAIKRKNEMISLGYKDAWIVVMKGNERLGF